MWSWDELKGKLTEMKSLRSLGTLGPQLMCPSNSQARSLFHLLANWFHLYLRKDKELCSGNVSLCSQALFLSSWWTGMEGMHLLVAIWWCPGNKWKSRSYPSSLCFGGKNHGGGGHSAGRGVQNKLSQFLQAAACQWIPTMASDSVSTEARKMGEAKWPVGGKGNLHYKSATSLPWIYSPKEGHFPAHTVSQTQLHPNCDAWCSLCFCF